jgi:hypothetical protein
MKKLFSSAAFATLAAGMLWAAPARATVTVTDDPILYWNQIMLGGMPGGPPGQSRSAAMVNIAMFDAVNAALGNPNVPYLTGVSSSGGDVRAAASQAAHDVLVFLNPSQAATYDAALAASLAQVSDAGARAAGAATGSSYAAAIIVNRTGDGASTAGSVPYTPGTDPGDWRPTPPANLPAALPGWGDIHPFLMASNDQFRPGAPPALDSLAYAAAYNQVMELGAIDSATRTADQTAAALFWNNANGTTWLQIGLDTAADEGLSTMQYAELFAQLGVGLADAFIAGFDTKYEYNFWRPISAIHEGDADGNPLTIGDADWRSLINAPNHPSYLSTHSIASGVSSTILAALLGEEAFCANLGGLTRCFDSFTAAAEDGADSRLWGGIHYDFDNQAGLDAGRGIGLYELSLSTFGAVPEPSTWAMLLVGFGLIGVSLRRKRRIALRQIA